MGSRYDVAVGVDIGQTANRLVGQKKKWKNSVALTDIQTSNSCRSDWKKMIYGSLRFHKAISNYRG